MRPLRTLAASAVLLSLAIASTAFAQGVAINGTGAPADTSAILDLTSASKGLLPPRLTQVQRGAIVLPATGLVLYQTDGVSGLYWNAGTPGAPSWKQVGEAGTGSSPWQVNGANIYYAAGNVGIQRSTPLAPLDILGGNWDVVNGEGDLRIGDAATRLKIGIALGGGGTGAATIMEQGPAGQYNVLSLGTQGNKVLHVVGTTQRVGIGTDAPTAPLGFPATVGRKITLYPGASSDYGFGISSARLQVYTDGPGSDIALGYDASGSFNEKFAFKGNGALAVGGSMGSPGQVLQSNGSSASPTWVSPTAVTYNNIYQATSSAMTTRSVSGSFAQLPSPTLAFSLPTAARAIVSFDMQVLALYCLACGRSDVQVEIRLDGNMIRRMYTDIPYEGAQSLSQTFMVPIAAGAHIMTIWERVNSGPDVVFGSDVGADTVLLVQVVPQ